MGNPSHVLFHRRQEQSCSWLGCSAREPKDGLSRNASQAGSVMLPKAGVASSHSPVDVASQASHDAFKVFARSGPSV